LLLIVVVVEHLEADRLRPSEVPALVAGQEPRPDDLHRSCLRNRRLDVDLDRDDERVGVGLHANEALVVAGAEPHQRVREIAEVVVLPDLAGLVVVVKVGDEPNPEQVNGEVDKKDDSGNETGAGEHEVEEDYVTVGYDKTKSFFDNISCEAATDRTKGKGKDWRQERKINSETFGVSARRGGFYNFRARGGYFNRNAMNPGGYRGNMGYNRGGYRPRNYNRNYNSNSTGIPQQINKNEQSEAQPVAAASGN